MKLLIEKKSGRKFPPPFDNDGKTAIAIGIMQNPLDPKNRCAYILENNTIVNCDICKIIKDLEDDR